MLCHDRSAAYLCCCCCHLSHAFISPFSPPVVYPSKGQHTSTLFFLHGLGDSAQGGWSELVPEFQHAFPGLKVVLPNAPVQPVTLNGGMRMNSWHDIKSLAKIDNEEFKGQ